MSRLEGEAHSLSDEWADSDGSGVLMTSGEWLYVRMGKGMTIKPQTS